MTTQQKTPQLNINTVNRDDRIERWHAATLVGYVAGIDARVQATDATVEIWLKAFEDAPFGLIRDTIDAWFLAYRNTDWKPPIDPADIRRQAKRQIEVEQTRQRSIEGPPRRAKSRVPRWFIEKGQREWGAFKDRDPNDYD